MVRKTALSMAAAVLLSAGAANAAPVTFSFLADGFTYMPLGFSQLEQDVTGTISGEFTVDDSLGTIPKVVETAEITSFSMVGQGWTHPDLGRFNRPIVELRASNTGTSTVLVGSDLFVSSLSLYFSPSGSLIADDIFFTNVANGTTQFTDFFFFDFVGSSTTTIVAQTTPAAIPLPSSLPLLLAGAGGLAMMRRRRARAETKPLA